MVKAGPFIEWHRNSLAKSDKEEQNILRVGISAQTSYKVLYLNTNLNLKKDYIKETDGLEFYNYFTFIFENDNSNFFNKYILPTNSSHIIIEDKLEYDIIPTVGVEFEKESKKYYRAVTQITAEVTFFKFLTFTGSYSYRELLNKSELLEKYYRFKQAGVYFNIIKEDEKGTEKLKISLGLEFQQGINPTDDLKEVNFNKLSLSLQL